MNILQQEDLVKGLPDQALIQQAQMPTGELPQFLVVSEIQRREKMRKSFAEAVPEQSIKDQVLSSGIAAMNPATDPLMASAMGVDGGQDPMMQQQMPMQDPMQQQMMQQQMMQDPMQQQMPMQDPMMQQQMMAAGGGMMPYQMDQGRKAPNITPRDHIASSFQLLEMGQISNRDAISESIRQLRKAGSSEELEELRSFIEYKAATSEGMPEDLADILYNYSSDNKVESLINEVERQKENKGITQLELNSILENGVSAEESLLLGEYGINFDDLTLGQRINNPFNIRPSDSNNWLGIDRERGEAGYEGFKSADYGIRAADKVLSSYGEQGINTISSIINRFAPPSDNNPTSSYIDFVANSVGVGRDEEVDLSNPVVRAALLSPMAKFETQSDYSQDDIVSAVSRANEAVMPEEELAVDDKFSPVKSLIDEVSRRREESTAAGIPSASIDSNAIREDIARNNEVDPPLAQYILAEESGGSKVNRKVQERQESALAVADQMKNARYEIEQGDTLSDIAESQGRSRSGIMSLNPQITDADRIYAGDTLNLSGGGITSYKMNAGRKTYSAEELAAIEALIVKGYSKEEAENIVRFTPTGETQEEIAESIYDYRSPMEAGRRGKRRIPGGETRESLMKRVLGDDVPDYMYSALRGRGAKPKFMDLATQGNVLDQFLPNQLPATVASPFDASASEEVIGNQVLTQGPTFETTKAPNQNDYLSQFQAFAGNKKENKGESQSDPIDFLSELQGFKTTYGGEGSSLGKLDYSGKDARTNFEGLLDAERTRSLEASKEMKADAMNNALVQLGAGIASGDLSKGLSNAGTVAMQGRKEARQEEKGMTGLERQMKLLGAQESSSLAREQIKANADIAKFNLQTAISEDKNTLEAFKALQALEIQRESADTAAKKQILDEKIGKARINLLESQAGWYSSGGSAKNPIVQAQTYYKNMGAKSQQELRKKHGSEAAAIQAIVAMMTSGEIDPMAMSGGPTALPPTGGGGHSILSVRND